MATFKVLDPINMLSKEISLANWKMVKLLYDQYEIECEIEEIKV